MSFSSAEFLRLTYPWVSVMYFGFELDNGVCGSIYLSCAGSYLLKPVIYSPIFEHILSSYFYWSSSNVSWFVPCSSRASRFSSALAINGSFPITSVVISFAWKSSSTFSVRSTILAYVSFKLLLDIFVSSWPSLSSIFWSYKPSLSSGFNSPTLFSINLTFSVSPSNVTTIGSTLSFIVTSSYFTIIWISSSSASSRLFLSFFLTLFLVYLSSCSSFQSLI